jgi:hypothetical protein
VYQPSLLSQPIDEVKSFIVRDFEVALDGLLAMANTNTDDRQLEERIWKNILGSAQLMMSAAIGLLCCRASEEDIRDRGLTAEQVRLRSDDDYWLTMKTTFGPVTFFSFAYRDSSSGVTTVTRTPAREKVFPLLRHCKSSQMLIELVTKLGQEMPFRKGQKALPFFTHDAVTLEDTTIERCMVTISRLVERQFLYQPPETIRDVLRTRATRDLKTGKPLIYLSTDAHMLRQLVGETWDARWKAANGLRLWCIDQESGRIIHLGGEYTWGDCRQVAEIVDWLISNGIVPADGDYGQGVIAQVALPTDGMPWFEDHVISKFSQDAVAILDVHHFAKHLRDYAAKRFGEDTPEAKKYCRDTLWLMLGRPQEKPSKPRNRKRGIQGSSESKRAGTTRYILPWESYELAPASVEVLLDQLVLDQDVPENAMEAHLSFIDFVEKNTYRMNYLVYRSRGYQIGSGAMESLHRSGSQVRLKLPGLKCLQETSQAIFNLRMLELNGRWDEFFHQPGFYDKLVGVFGGKTEEAEESCAEVISMVSEQVEEVLNVAA